MTIHWIEATQALHNAKTILVISHIRPDGDAIGSLLGLGNALIAMGKQVTLAVDDGVPKFVQFLPHSNHVLSELSEGTWDVMITTDVADEARAGKVGEYGFAHSQIVINLDHHPSNPRFGNYHLVVDNASSAAEVVFDWLEHMQFNLNLEVAMPLLCGLVTDTRGFRTSSTTPRALEIAMKLMQKGANLTQISALTLDSMTIQEFELWKRMLPSTVIDGDIAYTVVTQEMIQAVGMDDMTDAGLVSFLAGLDDITIACVFKQGEEQINVSMRSKLGYNVAKVAVALGGGGHIQAAGATLNDTLTEVIERVLPMLKQASAEGKQGG
jgi:bifunctional oligoribonuclease and PAP phosphatase NrnA